MNPLPIPHLLTLFLVIASALPIPNVRSATPQPQIQFKPKPTLSQPPPNSCSYTVTIKTSCASPSYTRDQISLAFGDSSGNEVYANRIDDPYSRTFERCSKDTFKITGPCVRSVCYVYLLRKGYDGWKPESVKIYGRYVGTVDFDYDVFLPNGVWYGFNNLCNSASAAAATDDDDHSLSAVM
ncbi:Embryo-specific protein ATS3A [Linum grandiflorum]